MDPEKQKRHERQAERVLDNYLNVAQRYDRDFLPRPFFIELTGPPSAGKTTTIKELDKFLRRHGFRVFTPQEGAEQIRHIPRTTYEYNVRTGLYALTHLMDQSYDHLYDIVILDRGLFDTCGWMRYWKRKEAITEEKRRLMLDFFLSEPWITRIDLAYIMACRPEVAIAREHEFALSDTLGDTTNPKTIQKLFDIFRNVYEELSPSHPQLHWLDTSEMTRQEMVESVATNMLDMMERKTHEKMKGT